MKQNSKNDQARQAIMTTIIRQKLVAIIRLKQQKWVSSTLDCLVEGGVKAIEITTNTPGFCEEIQQARSRHTDVLIGAGTVINAELAAQAIQAGAQFLVTPNVSKEVLAIAHADGVPVLMGALTPTEIAQAVSYQADAVKLFPASAIGVDYCKSIMAPFSDVPFFAVGGINSANMHNWLSAGVKGVGMGTSLCCELNELADRQEALAAISKVVNALS